MKQLFVRYYNEVYSKMSQSIDFELKDTKRNIALINSLLSTLSHLYKDSVGESFLWNYLIFQFRYYEGQNTRFGVNIVQLNWVTGEKALLRWQDKKENWLYWNEDFIRRFNIIKPKIEIPEDLEAKKRYITTERNRFYNTVKGFFHCHTLNLFCKYSKDCIACKFKKRCEK